MEPLPDTSVNRAFRAASLFCVALQGFHFVRHAFGPGYSRDFHAEPIVAVAYILLTQIMGSAFALGAGTRMLACMIANITCTIICLSLLWFV